MWIGQCVVVVGDIVIYTYKRKIMKILAFFRLRSHDVNLKFVTNTTKESKRCLMTRLHKIGFDIKPSELYTSLSAARHFIDKNNLRPMLMVDQRALEDFEGKQIFLVLNLLHMTIFISNQGHPCAKKTKPKFLLTLPTPIFNV